MKSICYECNETGNIIEKEIEYSSQFCTVKKYNILYDEELPRFQKEPLNIYAIPFFDKPQKIYNGTGRMGLDLPDKHRRNLTKQEKKMVDKIFKDFTFADELMSNEASALQYISLFDDADKYELIWVQNSGVKESIPKGYEFIGYDISYPCDYSGGFSIICDCMFICCWHGCDENGTFFLSDFEKLNSNGLFDVWQDAYDYMVKYLGEEWSERGEYCIFEIYKKTEGLDTD
ncbi:MAG: hypothetical protein ACI4II_07820 [Acutalibacteraceae bacterium]